MGKFKVGDKVRFIGDHYSMTHGKTYEVKSMADYGPFVRVQTNHGNIDGFFEAAFVMSDEPEFQVGDIVEAFGLRGVVKIGSGVGSYSLCVRFEGGYEESFASDGRLYEHHRAPSLKLIERPKKKKTVTMYPALFSQRNKFFISHSLYKTIEEAKEGNPAAIKLVDKLGIEVEVDDE